MPPKAEQTAAVSGGVKAAYRNYFLGNYYFNESQPQKAVGYFRKAYRAAPDRINFALALALTLTESGKAAEATALLAHAKRSLLPLHPAYEEQLLTYHYVNAIVLSRAARYGSAQASLWAAIFKLRDQHDDDPKKIKRLAGMYNLAAYLAVVSQEAHRSHAGLEAHAHLQERELLKAHGFYEQSLGLDSSRTDARQSLKLLSDTLAVTATIDYYEAPVPDYYRAGVYSTKDYPHLPNRMEALLPFGHYDELVCLVDISGSMVMEKVGCTAADRFTVMKEATSYLLDFLPDSTQAGMATIGGDCQDTPQWWIKTDSMSRKDLRWEIAHLNSNGTTPLLTTLIKAPQLFSESEETTKSIFFVSDGENVCSLPGLDICEWADRLRERNITLNVLTFLDQGLGNSGAFAEYACLADRSGGQVRYLDPVSCSIDDADFDLVDRIQFNLPKMERVECWGTSVEKLWAIYPE